jgi:hypothetical protein
MGDGMWEKWDCHPIDKTCICIDIYRIWNSMLHFIESCQVCHQRLEEQDNQRILEIYTHTEMWKRLPLVTTNRIREILQFNSYQLRHLTSLVKRICTSKELSLGTCEMCHDIDRAASHALCDCNGAAELRACHWGPISWRQVTDRRS